LGIPAYCGVDTQCAIFTIGSFVKEDNFNKTIRHSLDEKVKLTLKEKAKKATTNRRAVEELLEDKAERLITKGE